MNPSILGLILLIACTTTTKTPAPEAASAAAAEDTGGVSPKAPGQLAATLQQRVAEAPDATPPGQDQAAAEAPPPASETAPGEQVAQTEPVEAPTTPPGQPTPPPKGEKAPPPCTGLDGALSRAATGDTAGLDLDDQGRVHVTYDFTKPPTQLPEGFVQETAAMGHGQGWCPPAALCDLAATDGISRVRTVRRADPKPD